MRLKAHYLLIAFVFVVGCGYPDVSPTAYQLSMSLYNVSNRKLTEQLEGVDVRITEAESSHEITEREAEWLRKIVELAENEEWGKAMKSARRIMEDQVKN